MKYCSYCGSSVANNANFCPNCGGALTDGTKTVTSVYGEPVDLDTGYRIVLFSRGTCSLKNAKEVLCDLLGYTPATASDLLDNMPIEVADELTELQAVTIAQALAEYGMEVTTVDENDQYVDFTNKATKSVFDSTGALITSAIAALATLSAANRVHRYRRYKKPSLLQLLFRPRYAVPAPPIHRRRNVIRQPEPRYKYEVRRPQAAPHMTSPFAGSKPKPANNKPSSSHNSYSGFGNSKPAASKPSSGFGSNKKQTSSKPSFSQVVGTGRGVTKPSNSHSSGSKPSFGSKTPAGRGSKKR